MSANKGFEKFKRCQDTGLLDNVEYVFNDDGTINWRAMVKEEFLYPNHGWFKSRNKKSPDSIAGLDDQQLLIMLGGIKELAQLRGFTHYGYEITHVDPYHVSAICTIDWVPNYETGMGHVSTDGVASAHENNTDSFGMKFLETIASNRAFVRCVRNFLNIHIVGGDEVDKSFGGGGFAGDTSTAEAPAVVPTGPRSLLVSTLATKGIKDFDAFKAHLRALYKNGKYKNDDVADWTKFDDVPVKEARKIIQALKK